MSEPHWGPGFIEACFGAGAQKPSSDLVQRLRKRPCPTIIPPTIELEAADRIEQLERENQALRAALQGRGLPDNVWLRG